MAVTKSDWNAVDRQTYSADDQARFEAWLEENGQYYDSITDALTDWKDLEHN